MTPNPELGHMTGFLVHIATDLGVSALPPIGLPLALQAMFEPGLDNSSFGP